MKCVRKLFLIRTYFGWEILTQINWKCHKNIISLVKDNFFFKSTARKSDLIKRNWCHFWIQWCKILLNQLKEHKHLTKTPCNLVQQFDILFLSAKAIPDASAEKSVKFSQVCFKARVCSMCWSALWFAKHDIFYAGLISVF